ncbi:hypothetical protein PG996_004980 [Apiospora saccharicola]|uniref:Uncharacterized protein n=1 Tax=Apiospora saccharicola TaxID=335842 RepID=A0ABR1VLA4_9PEZI
MAANRVRYSTGSWSWASATAPVQVADRLTEYGDYFVTDHDGGALCFNLKRRAYEMPSEWIDGLPPATPPDMLERQLDVVSEALTIDKSHLDMMPELPSKALQIQGHISQGTLSMASNDGNMWQIDVQSPAGASGLIRAFPDRPPENDNMECLFVVMCAKNERDDEDEEFSDEENEDEDEEDGEEGENEEVDNKDDNKEDDNEKGERDDDDDDDDEDENENERGNLRSHSWSGNGIMVKLNPDSTYSRVGAIEFADLDGEMWAALRHQCRQRSLEQRVHETADGVKFTLV